MSNSINHNCCKNKKHTNVFVDLNGVPYLLAEYLDRETFQHVDRSVIRSEIVIDQSDAMRAIIDINIDDIGKRATDGLLSVVGNTTKQNKLIKSIEVHNEQMHHQLRVLRRGIIMRINYQLENCRTGQVIRSMVEDLRINDRNYFLDINSNDINDNAIIVNFCDTLVSTINNFTHGRDRMLLRITNIQMLYECVHPSPRMPHIKQSMCYNTDGIIPQGHHDDIDYFKYHDKMQNHHIIGNPGCCHDGLTDSGLVSPMMWSSFNRFYQFDNNYEDIILHGQEINDPLCKTSLIPCGTIVVNRTFIINPGHRLIFKFCIWKNDCVIVNDTTRVIQALKAPLIENVNGCNCNCDHHNEESNNSYDSLVNDIKTIKESDNNQNNMIVKILDMMTDLQIMVKDIYDGKNNNSPEIDNGECNCGCEVIHDEIYGKIDEIKEAISSIEGNENGSCDCEPEDEITESEVGDLWDDGEINGSNTTETPEEVVE